MVNGPDSSPRCLIVTEGRQDLGVVRTSLERLDLELRATRLDLNVLGEIAAFDPALLVVAMSFEDDRDYLVLRRLAEAGSAQVLAVSARHDWQTFSKALNCGADACLADDADSELVAAQIKALLRRVRQIARPDAILRAGDLSVDLDRCEVRRSGELIPLTKSEFRIVAFLMENKGKVQSAARILNAIQDYEYSQADALEILKVYVRRIRKKLETDPSDPVYIVNVRGFGYLLEDPAAEREGTGGLRVVSA